VSDDYRTGSIRTLRHKSCVDLAEGTVRDGGLEIGAFQQFHGHEEAAGVFAEIVDHHDVRVRQARRRLRLAMEALQAVVVPGGDDFQRHMAVEDGVVRAEALPIAP
jgi:hypothetical protein